MLQIQEAQQQQQEGALRAYEHSNLTPDQHKAQLGDLADRDHTTTIAVINGALQKYHAYNKDAFAQGQFPIDVEEHATHLSEGITLLRAHLDKAKETENYELLHEKIAVADAESAGWAPKDRMLHRLTKFDSVRFVTDLDGTWTQDPNSYLMRIPGSVIGEKLLDEHGRESFAYAASLSWMHPLEKTPEVFRQLGRELPLRTGVKEFMETRERNNVKDVTVLSANFAPIVEGVGDQLGQAAQGLRIIAIEPGNITSTDKGTYLSLMAISDPDTAIIFIGDGASDTAAFSANREIGGFGALFGEGFERQLIAANEDGANVPYFTYGHRHDEQGHATYDEVTEMAYAAGIITRQKQDKDKLAQTREALQML